MYKFNFKIYLFLIFSIFYLNCRNIEQNRKYIESRPFDKQKWSDVTSIGVDATWEIRPAMARDLVNRKTLFGKSKQEIIEMLGEPISPIQIHEREMLYELEVVFGSNIDPIAVEYLKIYLNQENKVEMAEIYFFKTHDWRE